MKFDQLAKQLILYVEGPQVLPVKPETEPDIEPDIYPTPTEPEVEPEYDPLEHPEPGHEPRPKAETKEGQNFLQRRGIRV
jgi:hypothetical protein